MAGHWISRACSRLREALGRGIRTEVWTANQRIALSIIVLAVVAALMIVLTRRPLQISDPQPFMGARARELATKIDPNEADWAALAVLPSIGERRAKEIVAYREEFLRKSPQRRAFESVEDLDKVKGIGAGTAEALRPYLIIRPVEVGSK